jgi:hypothetical protein
LDKPTIKEEDGKRAESVISELWGELGLLNFAAALEDGDGLKVPKSDFAVGSGCEQGLAGAETGVKDTGLGLGGQIGALTRQGEKEEVPSLLFDHGLRRAELIFDANDVDELARPGGREEDKSERRWYTKLHPTTQELTQSAGSPLLSNTQRFAAESGPDPRYFVDAPPPAKRPGPLLARKPLFGAERRVVGGPPITLGGGSSGHSSDCQACERRGFVPQVPSRCSRSFRTRTWSVCPQGRGFV